MRTIISLASFAGLMLLASCDKNYVCTCETGASGSDPSIITKEDLGKMRYSEARAKCKDKEGSVFGVTKSCHLE